MKSQVTCSAAKSKNIEEHRKWHIVGNA